MSVAEGEQLVGTGSRVEYIKKNSSDKGKFGRVVRDEKPGEAKLKVQSDDNGKTWNARKKSHFKVIDLKPICQQKGESKENDVEGPFISEHSLRVISWNCLKLKALENPGMKAFKKLVKALGEEKPDVIVLQEISKTLGENRVNDLKNLFLEQCNMEFESYFSTLNDDYHVVLVLKQEGLKYVQSVTFDDSSGSFIGNKTRIDHAPFCVHLVDDRFTYTSKNVLITSVHLPPVNCAATHRDLCFNALFQHNNYHRTVQSKLGGAGGEALPFTKQGATDVNQEYPATHIICGDFNKPLNEGLEILKENWNIILDSDVTTTAGDKSYDNFVVNKHAGESLNLCAKAMVFKRTYIQNSRSGQIGLSDHDPIILELEEKPKRETGKKGSNL